MLRKVRVRIRDRVATKSELYLVVDELQHPRRGALHNHTDKLTRCHLRHGSFSKRGYPRDPRGYYRGYIGIMGVLSRDYIGIILRNSYIHVGINPTFSHNQNLLDVLMWTSPNCKVSLDRATLCAVPQLHSK